jgi:HAD superfamily hydrolase (TIGR01493 family)
MGIQAISFDWGDTLAANYGTPHRYRQRRAHAALMAALRSAGGRISDAQSDAWRDGLEQAFRDSVDRVANPDLIEFDWAGMVAGWVAAAAPQDRTAATTAVATYGDAITATVPCFAASAGVLRELRSRGFRIGILSHVPWPADACRRWFVRHGLAEYLDFYSLSCEVGVIKPHPRHYEHALAEAGCAPGELLHVGDHPWRDVQGGRAAGVRTCLIMTEGIYPAELMDVCRPDLTVAMVDELPGLLGRAGMAWPC